MAYKIEFGEKALAEFENLDGSVKRQIQKYINKIEERQDPRSLGAPLQDNLSTFGNIESAIIGLLHSYGMINLLCLCWL